MEASLPCVVCRGRSAGTRSRPHLSARVLPRVGDCRRRVPDARSSRRGGLGGGRQRGRFTCLYEPSRSRDRFAWRGAARLSSFGSLPPTRKELGDRGFVQEVHLGRTAPATTTKASGATTARGGRFSSSLSANVTALTAPAPGPLCLSEARWPRTHPMCNRAAISRCRRLRLAAVAEYT